MISLSRIALSARTAAKSASATSTEFAQLTKLSQSKGLCSNCLKKTLFLEKNSETISDGEMEDHLILFRDYWDQVKDREGLTLIDLEEARALLRIRLNCKQDRGSGKCPDEDYRADGNSLNDSDAKKTILVDTNIQPSEAKVSLKRKKSNRKKYVGWGSEELIEFLSCIGKDTTKPLDQFGVTRIVKEYIQQKNLFQDRKKRSVACDDKLHSLFRKRKLKSNMIHSLLEIHLAENADSEDDYLYSSEDDEGPIKKKKPCTSLNLEKVVGSLVRVKNDYKSYTYQMSKQPYQLGLVTGIKKSSEEYKIKDTHTNILFCVSNIFEEVKISMLSSENIEEDECNYLLLLAKKELFKRPTVAELEEKAASLHVDIVNHWIDTELKRLLSTQAERQRRLAEIPEAIPDIEEGKKEDEFEVAGGNHFEGNKGVTEKVPDFSKVGVDKSQGATGQVVESSNFFKVDSLGGVTEKVDDFSKVGVENSQEGVTGQVADSSKVFMEDSLGGVTEKVADFSKVVVENSQEGAPGQVADSSKVFMEDSIGGVTEKVDGFSQVSVENSQEGATGQVADSSKVFTEDSLGDVTEKVADFSEVGVENSQEGAPGQVAGSSKVFMEDSIGEKVADFSEVGVENSQEGATGQVADSSKIITEDSLGGARERLAGSLEVATDKSPEDATRQVADSLEVGIEETAEGASEQVDATCEVALEGPDKAPGNGGTPCSGLQNQMHNAQDGGTTQGISGGSDKDRVIIDVDSDEDENLAMIAVPTNHAPAARITAPIYRLPGLGANNRVRTLTLNALRTVNESEFEPMWNYLDPHGEAHGPFPMMLMRRWHRSHYFAPGFRVWRLGQTQEQSVLLTDAMGQIF
ncbi:hypothetical protein GUJ93_ZPchr0001g29949 [Zizania palustris]|uniref:GYF domain-containing protein n=1 Tax=Zizania palustris TaxID=103762 RepID=A0A8J5VTN1_ZIZPA|nr:hypothetical protein GUJ93_ZPchr0001g29949 [Zizania palustris]